MPMERNVVDPECFNPHASLPYELRTDDFRLAIQDVYDFFYDVNRHLTSKGLQRLDDMLRPAIMSGVLSDMLTSSLVASHARVLVENRYFNGHPRPRRSGNLSQQCREGRRGRRRDKDH